MRPTNKYSINVYNNTPEDKATFDEAVLHIWDVDVTTIPKVTFKDIYTDGHNSEDPTARDWLLAVFESMCPIAVDSDVLSKHDVDAEEVFGVYDEDAWSPVNTEAEALRDVETVLAQIEEAGLDYYEPGNHCGHVWPCVEVRSSSKEDDKLRVSLALAEIGWKLGRVQSSNPNEIVYEVVPEDYEHESEEENVQEDGWFGILLSAVFIVREEIYAHILSRAGFRVLKHDDTGTVVTQVTYCGMSNEPERARAGFLLCADRQWPILTRKGWCLPVT